MGFCKITGELLNFGVVQITGECEFQSNGEGEITGECARHYGDTSYARVSSSVQVAIFINYLITSLSGQDLH